MIPVETDQSIEEIPQKEGVLEEPVHESLTQGISHQNFDHILSSLTRYLIHDLGEVAMVENCPGGYTYHQGYKDYICTNSDERWLEFEWLDGTLVRAPNNVGLDYLSDRTFMGGASFQQSFSPDFKYWIYLERMNIDEPILWALNTRTGETQRLMSFLELTDFDDTIRFVGMNNGGTRFAALIYRGYNSNYPKGAKLYVFDFADGVFTNKRSFDISVAGDWIPNNGPFFMIDWQDVDTIAYFSEEDYEAYLKVASEDTEEASNLFGRLFWNLNERNKSQYLHLLEIY